MSSLALFAAGMLGISSRFLSAGDGTGAARPVKVGPPGRFPPGLTYVPEARAFVARTAEGLRALSAVCTHLGCTVNWVERERHFACPCHGSLFDPNGAVLAGPARHPLPWLLVTLADGELVIHPGHEVEAARVLREVKG